MYFWAEFVDLEQVEVLVVPATSAATPAPTTASTGELEPVGPIPLASGAGDTATDRYYAKVRQFNIFIDHASMRLILLESGRV